MNVYLYSTIITAALNKVLNKAEIKTGKAEIKQKAQTKQHIKRQ